MAPMLHLLGGLTAGFFLFFPDAAHFLGKSILSLKTDSAKSH